MCPLKRNSRPRGLRRATPNRLLRGAESGFQYLGLVNTSWTATNSLCNPTGKYGSPASPTSVRNPNGEFGIGFIAEVKTGEQQRSVGELLHDVEPSDLIRYGLIPEFVGRLPVVATLEALDEDALVQILLEPKNALTKQYRKLFDMEGVDLVFRDDALRAVAKRAMKRKTGARGLRTILESVLLDTMYDLPSSTSAKKVVLDEAVVIGETKPYVIYESDEPPTVTVEQQARSTGSDR